MGRKGKASRTGREVIDRMRKQGKIVTIDGEDMLLGRAPGSDKVWEVPMSEATWDTTQSTPWITGTTWASITVLGRPRCGNGCSMRTTTNCSRPATTALREPVLAAPTTIPIEKWTCGSVAVGPATRGCTVGAEREARAAYRVGNLEEARARGGILVAGAGAEASVGSRVAGSDVLRPQCQAAGRVRRCRVVARAPASLSARSG